MVPPPGSRDDGDVMEATGGSLVPPGVSGAPLNDCSKGLGSRFRWLLTAKEKMSGVLPEGCDWAGRGGGASGLAGSALDAVVAVAVVVDGAASGLGAVSSLDSGLASIDARDVLAKIRPQLLAAASARRDDWDDGENKHQHRRRLAYLDGVEMGCVTAWARLSRERQRLEWTTP